MKNFIEVNSLDTNKKVMIDIKSIISIGEAPDDSSAIMTSACGYHIAESYEKVIGLVIEAQEKCFFLRCKKRTT